MTIISNTKSLAVAAVVAAAAMLMSAYAAISATDPSALVLDQRAKNQSISIDYIYLPENGYVAIYNSDEQGRPSGPAIGHANLNAGDHRGVEVKLSEQLKSGERLWVSLYKDVDGRPKFDPGQGDVAFWPEGQLPEESAFIVR